MTENKFFGLKFFVSKKIDLYTNPFVSFSFQNSDVLFSQSLFYAWDFMDIVHWLSQEPIKCMNIQHGRIYSVG